MEDVIILLLLLLLLCDNTKKIISILRKKKNHHKNPIQQIDFLQAVEELSDDWTLMKDRLPETPSMYFLKIYFF
jgi:hypothetical protein